MFAENSTEEFYFMAIEYDTKSEKKNDLWLGK